MGGLPAGGDTRPVLLRPQSAVWLLRCSPLRHGTCCGPAASCGYKERADITAARHTALCTNMFVSPTWLAWVLSLASSAGALSPTLGATPAMGYNTWNDLRCEGVTAHAIRERADALVILGLRELGYVYLNIDDCWAIAIDAEGRLIEDPKAFPEGLRAVADYVHGLGLKLGLYADRGFKTCAFRPGSGGHELVHAQQFASWGVDYLKYDSCYASSFHETAFAEYAAMRDALNASGRPILFSLCGWNAWYAPMGTELGHSWRIAPDCDEWANVYVAIRTNERLAPFAGPGGFNDPDMLVGSDPSAAVHLAPHQVQAQFSMWAVMAAPLLLGSRLLDMGESDLATYRNREVIAISQDALGLQGAVVWSNCPPFEPRDNFWMSPWSMPYDVAVMWTYALSTLIAVLLPTALLAARSLGSGGTDGQRRRGDRSGREMGGCCRCCLSAFLAVSLALSTIALLGMATIWYSRPMTDPCQQVWSRPLADGSRAVCMINFAPIEAAVVCDRACLARAGLSPDSGGGLRCRDAAQQTDCDGAVDGVVRTVSAVLPAEGGSALFRLWSGDGDGDGAVTAEGVAKGARRE